MQGTYCNFLVGKIAAGVCCEIINAIALHHQQHSEQPIQSSSRESIAEAKKPASLKKQILQKQEFFDLNFKSKVIF